MAAASQGFHIFQAQTANLWLLRKEKNHTKKDIENNKNKREIQTKKKDWQKSVESDSSATYVCKCACI